MNSGVFRIYVKGSTKRAIAPPAPWGEVSGRVSSHRERYLGRVLCPRFFWFKMDHFCSNIFLCSGKKVVEVSTSTPLLTRHYKHSIRTVQLDLDRTTEHA